MDSKPRSKAGSKGSKGSKGSSSGNTNPLIGSETELMAAVHLHRLEIARYRAEAVAARLGTDCDRMLRMVPATRRPWRDAIGDALLACRNIVSQAQASMGAGEDEAGTTLAELEGVTRVEMQRVADAMATLLRHVPATTQDELFIGDARGIHHIAIATQSAAALDSVRSGPDDSPLARAAAARPDSDPGVPKVRGQAATILVADDEETIRKILQRQLTKLGFNVLQAENGRAAMNTVMNNPVDLVITDLEMPVMNGLEFLKELKASPGVSYLPVIIVSGQGDTAKAIKTIELGAEDYLSKPFDTVLLQARVRASLARKRLRDLELDHLKRVSKLAAAAEAVERDLYTPGSLKDISSGHDEIAHLSRVFERMIVTIRSREERLAQRLRLLRGEMSSVPTPGSVATIASSDSPFSTGEKIAGRYEIIGKLGRGGMGTIYHAKDTELHVEIALKVVRSDLVKKDPTLVDRLKSEIRLARQLSHPNILRAHDLGEFRGTHFITMEYVRGVGLAKLLDQRGRLSVDAAVAIGVQLADALSIAHAAKIIHRDIKPANLIMEENGVLKVMDFGLAKSLSADKAITQSGLVIGTPQHMSPEQLMGGELDARSDLFSAGVLLYECLCGKTPFDAEEPVVIMTQMVDGTYPPLSSVAPDVPPALEAVISRLLMLKPELRVQTASELSRLLGEIETSPTP